MDAGLTIRPNSGAMPTAALARPAAAPAPAQQTVPTDLPAAKTVTAAQNATPLRNDLKRAEESLTRDVVLDPQTREVVYKVIDTRFRQVVRQVPSEALLRMRAYTRAIARGASPNQAQADIEA